MLFCNDSLNWNGVTDIGLCGSVRRKRTPVLGIQQMLIVCILICKKHTFSKTMRNGNAKKKVKIYLFLIININ